MGEETIKRIKHIVNNLINIHDSLILEDANNELVYLTDRMIKIGKYILTDNEMVEVNEYLDAVVLLKSVVVAKSDARKVLVERVSKSIERLDTLLKNNHNDYTGFISYRENRAKEHFDNEQMKTDKIVSRIKNLDYQFGVIRKFIEYSSKKMSNKSREIYLNILEQYESFSRELNVGPYVSKTEYILIQRVISNSLSCIISLKSFDESEEKLNKLSELASKQKILIEDYNNFKNKGQKTL